MASAKDVPALVAAHQDYLGNPEYRAFAGYFMRSLFTKSNTLGKYQDVAEKYGTSVADIAYRTGEQWAVDEREMLFDVPLYHVSVPMMEVAKYAAEQLPDLERWEEDTWPTHEGFLVFERPLRINDVWGRPSGIAAISWRREVDRDGLASYASGRTDTRGVDRSMTLLSTYAAADDPLDVYSVEINRQHGRSPAMGRWMLSHYEGISDEMRIGPYEFPDGEDFIRRYREQNAKIDMELHDDPEFRKVHQAMHPEDFDADGNVLGVDDPLPERNEPGVNTERIIYAIFKLMNQTIAQKDVYTDKRHARRMRHKKRGTPPMVTVITLRRQEEWGYYEEGTGNWLTYRTIVRAHWQWYHLKDGTKIHKYVGPYWRGPEGAPIRQPKRVNTLAR